MIFYVSFNVDFLTFGRGGKSHLVCWLSNLRGRNPLKAVANACWPFPTEDPLPRFKALRAACPCLAFM